MSRIRRIKIPNIPYHVTHRGNRRQNIFYRPEDYQIYLGFLSIAAKAHNFDILSFCLMTNHVHLLVVPHTPQSLSDGIGQAHHAYSKYINSRKNWKGTLWQGRFFSNPIEESRLPVVARYIELNPVRVGMVRQPTDYPWSSVAAKRNPTAYGNLGEQCQKFSNDWGAYLVPDDSDGVSFNEIRKTARIGRVLGSKDYIKHLESKHGVNLSRNKPGRQTKS